MSKNKKLTMYIVFVALQYLILFVIPMISVDELWNFNMGRQIANGLVPYKDISMLQSPLSFYIEALLIKITDTMFIMRILSYIVHVAIASIIVYRAVQSNISHLWIILFNIVQLFQLVVNISYDYNMLILLFMLVACELRFRYGGNKNSKYNFIEPLIIGLLPLIKQSTGIVVLATYIIIDIIKTKKVKKSLISIVPGTLYFVYLELSGNLSYFLEYAVTGTKYFVKYSMIENINSIIICYILVISGLVFKVVSNIMENKDNNTYYFMFIAYSIMNMYPSFDAYHCKYIITALIYMYICSVHKKEERKINIAIPIVVHAVVLELLVFIGSNFISNSTFDKNYGVFINNDTYRIIQEVNSYIKEKNSEGKEVYIASYSAASFTVGVDRYIKNWDMLLMGNLGETTVDELLDIPDGSIILVSNSRSIVNGQDHVELIQTVKERYNKVDSIACFDAYLKE